MKPRTRWVAFYRAIRVFLTSPTGVISLLFLLPIALLAMIGPNGFGAEAIDVNVVSASQGPSRNHLLGTDSLGRDILQRTLAATRVSVGLALISVSIAMVVGCLLGAMFGASRGRMRMLGGVIIDTLMGFGTILLAIMVIVVVGAGTKGAVIAVGIAFIPVFARFSFSLVSNITSQTFVESARVTGVPRKSFLGRYIGLNIADSMVVAAFNAIGECIMAMAALSFLGLGTQPPLFDWGRMLTDGVREFYQNPYGALAPAIMISLTGVAVSFLGDAIARSVNPVLWRNDATVEKKRTWRFATIRTEKK